MFTRNHAARPPAATKTIQKINDRGFRGYARMCHTKDKHDTTRQAMLMNRKAEPKWPGKAPRGRDSIAQGAAQRSPGFAPHSAMPAPTGRDSHRDPSAAITEGISPPLGLRALD